MWLLLFLFFITTFIIGWFFFGYFILIWCIGLLRKKKDPEIPSALPVISLVVPCLNEEKQIIAKLDNVRALSYPRELLEVVFVDGGSSDRTVESLSAALKEGEPYRIVKYPSSGKISQLNYILPQLKGEIIVNTDVDALLSADALMWIAAEFSSGEDILVVGAYSMPVDTIIEIERYYWSSQNKGRLLETDAMSSSIVVAPCYAFRKALLGAFPEDVVADDIYVAFLAHARGGRVIYSRKATATETRGPKGYEEFLPHKFRKSNAFLRESLRFLYLLPEMNLFCKMMFIARVSQQLILPWALLFWFMLAGALLTMFRFDMVIFALILLLGLFAITSNIFSSIKLIDGRQRQSIFVAINGYFLTLFIMLATGLSYPFFKQGSNYARIKDD